MRAGFLLYLIAPQTQGAKVLYQTRVHPFLQEHETSIEDFIASAHEQAKTAGLNYLKQVIELLKQNLLGQAPSEQVAPAPSSTTPRSYTQSLIARFNLPDARPAFPTPSMGGAIGGAQSTAADFYSLLASAVSAASGTGTKNTPVDHDIAAHQLSKSGVLVPPSLTGRDRISFITDQRNRLSILLSALDKEAISTTSDGISASSHISAHSLSECLDGVGPEIERPMSAMSGLSKSRSEVDFEKIESDVGSEDRPLPKPKTGSWMPWSWGGRGVQSVDSIMEKNIVDNDKAKSSAVDL